MSRLAIAILTSLALSLPACAEKPGKKKDDKKDAKDGKRDAKDGKAKADPAGDKTDAKADAKGSTPPAE
ncbi:MAG TPA: hypothetical protein VFG69_04385 [Nannocystaceae bacterium]|nr:hypothetical protein [Nannocystaceae bacterium]